jgi:glycosyltransferase involved in cell wall biosynthesis
MLSLEHLHAKPMAHDPGARPRVVMIATGAYEYTVELVNALSAYTHVSLFGPRQGFANLEWALQPTVDVHLLEWPRHRDPRSLFFVLHLEQLIRQLQPDVLHFQAGQVWPNLLMPLLDQCAFVSTVHDVVPHIGDTASEKLPSSLREYSVRHAHRLITHGDKMKVALAHRLHLPLDRIDVIPHGVLSLYCRLLSSSNGSARENGQEAEVLFFGRIYRYKGLDYLIQAQPAITRAVPEARIVIAGQGEDFQRYDAMLPERDKFKIYNEYVSNEQVAKLVNRAKVVALPYVDGSQSGVLQVAYAFGKPVVATRVGSIDEAVDEGRTGLLVPPRDSQALAEAIIELLRDENKRQRMSQHIAQQVATRFAWSNIAAATIQTYQRAIAERRGKN